MQHSSAEPHVYDNALKALFGDEVAQILPGIFICIALCAWKDKRMNGGALEGYYWHISCSL